MASSALKVTILGGIAAEECDAGCGTDWSLSESVTLAAERIKERFGNTVVLEYIDISADTADTIAAGWKKEIAEKDLSLPLLLVNNHVRISGRFDIRQLLDVIETELEVGIRNG